VRNEAVQSGQISQNEPPIEHAKTVLREDLNLTTRELAEKAGVSQGTAQKAKKLVAAESEPETKSEPKEKPVDPEQETKKKAEQFRATVRKTFAQWTKEWWTKQWLEEIGIDAMKEIIRDETKAWLGAVAGTGMALNVEVAD
jgi:hypothetical protein